MTIFLGFTTGLFLGAILMSIFTGFIMIDELKAARDTILECNDILPDVTELLYKEDKAE